MTTQRFSTQLLKTSGQLLVCLLVLGMLVLSGCGGTAPSPAPPPPGDDTGPNFNQPMAAAESNVQIRIGDAPSERIVALKLMLKSIQATPASGSKVDLLSSPAAMEVTHLASSNQLLAELRMPQGNYKQLSVSVSSAEVTYLDPVTNQPVQKQFTNIPATTINFNPTLKIVSGGNLFNLDVDVAKTVNLDLIKNTVSLNAPVINVVISAVGTPGKQLPESGALEHIIGHVISVSGSAFTIQCGQSGASLTFGTDNNTVFVGANLNSLTGTIVDVKASSLEDGTLLATEVDNVNTMNGMAVEGLVTGYTDWGYLNVVMQDGCGAGMNESMLGASLAMGLDGNTSYSFDDSGMDLTGLSYVFDESSIVPGQRVEVQSFNSMQADPQGMAAGFVTASKVVLQKQTVSGTVSNYAKAGDGTATFDLVLSSDGNSYLSATNPGTLSIEVHQTSATDLSQMPHDPNGRAARVRGLLFYYDPGAFSAHKSQNLKAYIGGPAPPSPYFVMVASRIAQ